MLLSLCSSKPQSPQCMCLSLQSWGGGDTGSSLAHVLPSQMDRSKEICWFFSLLSFLLIVMTVFTSQFLIQYGERETRSQYLFFFFFFTYHESCKTQIILWCSTLIFLASLVYPSIKYYDFLIFFFLLKRLCCCSFLKRIVLGQTRAISHCKYTKSCSK